MARTFVVVTSSRTVHACIRYHIMVPACTQRLVQPLIVTAIITSSDRYLHQSIAQHFDLAPQQHQNAILVLALYNIMSNNTPPIFLPLHAIISSPIHVIPVCIGAIFQIIVRFIRYLGMCASIYVLRLDGIN